jgi:hypothetical protein
MIQENVEHPCYCTHAFYKLVFLFSVFFFCGNRGFLLSVTGGLLPWGLAATLLMMQNLNLNVNFLSLSLSLCALHLELLQGH